MTWSDIATVALVWALTSTIVCLAIGRAIAMAEERRSRCGGTSASSDVGFVPSQAIPVDLTAEGAVLGRDVREALHA